MFGTDSAAIVVADGHARADASKQFFLALMVVLRVQLSQRIFQACIISDGCFRAERSGENA